MPAKQRYLGAATGLLPGAMPQRSTCIDDEPKLAEFAVRYQVAELAVFGSALRDDFTSTSDVDLLVTFLPGAEVSLFDLVDMGDELSRLLGRPVDLVPKSGIKPRSRETVFESSRIIYAVACGDSGLRDQSWRAALRAS